MWPHRWQPTRHPPTPSLGFSRQEHWSGLSFPSPMHESEKWKWSRSVVSDSSRPHGLQPTRLLCSWDFPGKSTAVGCHRLLRFKTLLKCLSRDTLLTVFKTVWFSPDLLCYLGNSPNLVLLLSTRQEFWWGKPRSKCFSPTTCWWEESLKIKDKQSKSKFLCKNKIKKPSI